MEYKYQQKYFNFRLPDLLPIQKQTMQFNKITMQGLRNQFSVQLKQRQHVKQFWKYVNSHLKTQPSINSLKCDDDSIVDSDQDKCQVQIKFYRLTKPSFTCNTNTDIALLPYCGIAITSNRKNQ